MSSLVSSSSYEYAPLNPREEAIKQIRFLRASTALPNFKDGAKFSIGFGLLCGTMYGVLGGLAAHMDSGMNCFLEGFAFGCVLGAWAYYMSRDDMRAKYEAAQRQEASLKQRHNIQENEIN